MNRLAITIPFCTGESFASFCSRLAEANNSGSLQTFCSDLGISHRSVRLGLASALSEVAAVSGTDENLLRTGLAGRTENGYLINGEILTGKYYSRSSFRYCPHCLREDISRNAGPVSSRPYGRLVWNVSFIRTCHVHGVLLARADRTIGIDLRDDFALIQKGLPDSEREASTAEADATDFERYVSLALEGGRERKSWIDTLPLYVVGHLSEVVGGMRTHGRKFRSSDVTEAEWVRAGQAGFEVLRGGADAFGTFLRSMQDSFLGFTKNGYAGRALYGTLFVRLEQQLDDPNYDVIRDFVRTTTIESLPFGPEDTMFGPFDMPRRLHSIQTAVKQSGVPLKRLRRRLVHEGLIDKKDMRARPHKVLVEVGAMERLLAEMSSADKPAPPSTLVAEAEAMRILGVSRNHWHRISEAFGLRERPYARVARADLDGFVAWLKSCATEIPPAAGQLQDVAAASVSLRVSIVEILQLVLDRVLRVVSVDEEAVGLRQILIDSEEVQAGSLRSSNREFMSAHECAEVLQIDVSSANRLGRDGVLKKIEAPGRLNYRFRRAEVTEFSNAFASLKRAALAEGVDCSTLFWRLEREAIGPEIGGNGGGARFYRLSALAGVLAPSAIELLKNGR